MRSASTVGCTAGESDPCRKGGKGEFYAWHFLTDDEGTRCGRDVADLRVDQETDLDTLPLLEACGSCNRVVNGWVKPEVEPGGSAARYVGPAVMGRISKAGPLRQTARSGHGSKLR